MSYNIIKVPYDRDIMKIYNSITLNHLLKLFLIAL